MTGWSVTTIAPHAITIYLNFFELLVAMDNSKAEYAISIFADPTNIKEMTKGRVSANSFVTVC